jgi:hypothetical protein
MCLLKGPNRNPLCGNADYRSGVCALLPQVAMLDGEATGAPDAAALAAALGRREWLWLSDDEEADGEAAGEEFAKERGSPAAAAAAAAADAAAAAGPQPWDASGMSRPRTRQRGGEHSRSTRGGLRTPRIDAMLVSRANVHRGAFLELTTPSARFSDDERCTRPVPVTSRCNPRHRRKRR